MSSERVSPKPYYHLNPSPVARRLLWHVLGVGRSVGGGVRTYSALDKPGVVALWLHSGEGSLRLPSGDIPLRTGPRCWLFNVRQSREFRSQPGRPLVLESIRFSGPGVEAWLEELAVARQPEFHLKRFGVLPRSQARLLALVQQRPPDWEWRAHEVLHSMLREFYVAREEWLRRQANIPGPVQRAINSLETDPFRDWNVSELAARAGLGESSFRAQFRAAMNEPPHQYLQRCRLDRARELLSDPHLRIKEIAERLHFSNEDYFTKFFRKLTGVSPTEFRKQLEPSVRESQE